MAKKTPEQRGFLKGTHNSHMIEGMSDLAGRAGLVLTCITYYVEDDDRWIDVEGQIDQVDDVYKILWYRIRDQIRD